METIANLDVQMPPRTTDDTKVRRRHQPKAGDQDSLTRAQLQAAMSGLSNFFLFLAIFFLSLQSKQLQICNQAQSKHKLFNRIQTLVSNWILIQNKHFFHWPH